MKVDPRKTTAPIYLCKMKFFVEKVGDEYLLLQDAPEYGLEVGDAIPRWWRIIPVNWGAYQEEKKVSEPYTGGLILIK